MDPSRLWLLKYVLGPETLAKLEQGALGREELVDAANKVLATMLPTPAELDGQTKQYFQVRAGGVELSGVELSGGFPGEGMGR
jgi:hypothetical protein